MANILVRGLKFSNPTALRNVGFIQRGFAHVLNGHTGKLAQIADPNEIFRKGEDGNVVEKTTSIFIRKPKPTSGGLIQMFSSGPTNPGINKGPPPQHDEKPGSKGAGKPAKDTGSDPKNLHDEPEAKNN